MSVQVTRLPSGLTVASDVMPDVETVSLGIWVGVGTRNEAPEVNGVAHLLEHMAFKGTRRRSAFDIAEQIERVGGHLNAYTGRETTAYYAKTLAGDAPLALDIIADILQHSVFDEGELARERTVVLQEIGQAEDTPDDIIFDHLQEIAFPGQPIGRPVLGRADIVRRMPREALTNFLKNNYGAERMILSAAGQVEHEALCRQAELLFAELPRTAPPGREPARYQGGDYREARDLEQIHLLFGFEGVGFSDPDYYAASVLSTLLGGGMSSRLFQEVREKRGLVYSIYSFLSPFTDGGLFGIYAGTGEKEVSELLPVVADELNRLAKDAPEEELARARAQLKASILMARESSSSRAEQAASQILVFGRPLSSEEIVAKIEAVDAAAVRRVAGRLLSGDLTFAALGPIDRLESYDRFCARLS